MSEYIMNHTGEQLDEAIGKVLNGYIYPTETITITEKDNNTEVDVTKCALAKVQIPIPTFTTASISITPQEGDFIKRVASDEGCNGFSEVIVSPIPEQYVDLSKLILHCSEGKYATTTWNESSDKLLSSVSFDFGFKPKVFIVTNSSGIISNSTSTSKVHLLTSLFITDDDYNILLRFSSYLYYHTTNKLYMGSRSASSSNTFAPTDTGAKGGSGTTVYFRGGNTYQVYAWG